MQYLWIKRGFGPKDSGMETEPRLDMIEYDLGLSWYSLDGKPRVHHEQHIKIVGELFAGDKTTPQKHTSKLACRFREGQETAQLLPQPLPPCRRGGKAGEDLVFWGQVNTFWQVPILIQCGQHALCSFPNRRSYIDWQLWLGSGALYTATIGLHSASGTERWRSPAAGSRSEAEAVGSQVQRQTVSKPRFWSMQTLQAMDFVRLHFQKIDF